MKRLKHVSGWVCSAAVLVTVLITPINGIITLSIPDGDSDSFVWTAARDHPNKRIGDNHRQWLEDEAERRGSKAPHKRPDDRDKEAPLPPETSPQQPSAQESGRKRLDDWIQDPIA